jgi:hypothetical protein
LHVTAEQAQLPREVVDTSLDRSGIGAVAVFDAGNALVQYLPGDAAQVVHDLPDGFVVARSRKARCAGCVLANSTGEPAAARKALRAAFFGPTEVGP